MLNDIKKFKIPKDFILFGSKYFVSLEKDLYEKENCYGISDSDARTIKIQAKGTVKKEFEEDGIKKSSIVEITDETIVETFYHELFHIILDAIGEDILSENEKFVNIMGKAMLEIYLYSDTSDEEKK